MSNKKLFLFTIGPVKSFINDSRKTQDLFGGSALLSRLTHEAIKEAQKQFGKNNFNLITPVYDINSFNTDKQGIPNRFLAEIKIDAKDIKNKAEKVKNKVIEFFVNSESFEQAKKQLQNALDIFWVAIDRTDDYKTDFIRINMELAAAKNYKIPAQLNEKGRKCMVDGKRNVVYYRKNKADKKYTNDNDLSKKKLFQPKTNVKIYTKTDKILQIWHLQEGEGISAVTLRKRLYLNNPHNFPSTASIALMDLFNEVKDNDDFNKYKEKVNGEGEKFLEHSDDQLFYYENIEPICKEHEKTDDEIKNCQDMHQKWAKNAKKPFTKYYALVRFDGDNMGDWFTGIHFKNDIELLKAQQALSKALGNFSKEIYPKIKAPVGKVIYAGGEDFMAFINIHHLDKALNNILETFDEKVNKDAELTKYKKDGAKISLSIGIAVAHYKQPLSMVLQKAQDMEKTVKENGRNGFAVGIIKHSGSVLEYRYKTKKYTIQALDHIQEIINLLQDDKKQDKQQQDVEKQQDKYFSPAFITNIYGAFEKYGFDISESLIKSKIDLYTSQAYTGKSDDKEKILKLRELLKQLLTISPGRIDDNVYANINFGNTLLAIDFMYRKTK